MPCTRSSGHHYRVLRNRRISLIDPPVRTPRYHPRSSPDPAIDRHTPEPVEPRIPSVQEKLAMVRAQYMRLVAEVVEVDKRRDEAIKVYGEKLVMLKAVDAGRLEMSVDASDALREEVKALDLNVQACMKESQDYRERIRAVVDLFENVDG